jgi:hypothetical protein
VVAACDLFLLPVMQSAAAGAIPTLCAATAENAEHAGFYGPSRLSGLRGPVMKARIAKPVQDDAAAKRLFDEAEATAGIHYHFDWHRLHGVASLDRSWMPIILFGARCALRSFSRAGRLWFAYASPNIESSADQPGNGAKNLLKFVVL